MNELTDTDGYVKPSKQQLFAEKCYFIMVTGETEDMTLLTIITLLNYCCSVHVFGVCNRKYI